MAGAGPVRDGAAGGFGVALERGFVAQVVGGVVAHDVEDAAACLAGVVEVGCGVGEAGGEVEEGGGDPARHPVIAVGGAGRATFEQAKDAAHFRVGVEGGHEVHLRGAGVGKTSVDSRGEESLDEGFGSVHGVFPGFVGGWSQRGNFFVVLYQLVRGVGFRIC